MWQHTPDAIWMQTEMKLKEFEEEARRNRLLQGATNVAGWRSWLANRSLHLADRIEPIDRYTRDVSHMSYHKRPDSP